MSSETLLEVELVERVGEGSPRWLGRAPYRDIRGHRGDPFFGEGQLQMEMMYAWGNKSEPTYDLNEGVPYSMRADQKLREFFSDVTAVHTCVNPTCEDRTQEVFVPDMRRLRLAHQLDTGCDNCGQDLAFRLFRPIENKWVYVFEGDFEGDVTLSREIYAAGPSDWRVKKSSKTHGPRSERVMDRSSTESIGNPLAVTPGVHYQFFLSPIQLSEGALAFLTEVARAKPVEAPHGSEQLVNTTVGRAFFAESAPRAQSRTQRYDTELVPVADPFAMAQEVNEWDFRPALTALYTFRLNQNLHAKLAMAGTLASLITGTGGDRYDLVDELETEASRLSAWNGAKGWLDRYEKNHEMLAEAADEACQRMVAWIDSDAHGIVELACQQEPNTPGTGFPLQSSLGFAFVHYASVFNEILGTQAGEAFVTRLHATTATTVDTPVSQRERRDGHASGLSERPLIPSEYLLLPANEKRRALDRVPSSIRGVAASVLAIFAPVIIRERATKYREAALFVEYLDAIGVKADLEGTTDRKRPMGFKDLRISDDSLRLSERKLRRVERTLLPKRMDSLYVTKITEQFGQLFGGKANTFTSMFSLWTGVSIYATDRPSKERGIDRIAKTTGRIEYPFKLFGFAVAQGQTGLAWWAKSEYGIDLSTVAAGKTTFASSEGLERLLRSDLDRFTRNVRAFSTLTKAGRILTGPVALLFGGIDLVIQLGETFEAWKNGDYGVAAGSGFLAAGALTAIVAWVVPGLEIPGVNVIVAALVLLGLVVTLFWAKNSLELFAAHSFLGDDYGQGTNDGPPWADGEGYRSWDDGRDRFLRQHRYLLNLICGFRAAIDYSEPRSVQVRPGYLPPGSFAEVTIVNHYEDQNGEPVDRSSTAIIDMDTGEHVITGDELEDVEVVSNYTKFESVTRPGDAVPGLMGVTLQNVPNRVRPVGPRAEWGSEGFHTFYATMNHKTTTGLRTRPIGVSDPDATANWTARVRFHVFTGIGPNPTDMYVAVPGQTKSVELTAKEAATTPGLADYVHKSSTTV